MAGTIKTSSEIMLNQELAEELHKPIIRKFEKQKVHSSFMDNIWDSDLANIELISKFNIEIRFLLCFINIFIKYAWAITLKCKRGITITNFFQKNLDASNGKPNKTWVDKRSK